jgi:NADH dehydrogenase
MVGRFRVVARLPLLSFGGTLAWLVWLGVHLYYLRGLQNRLVVSMRWASNLFTGARGSRLITAPHASHGGLPLLGALGDADQPAALTETRRHSSA